MGTVPEWSQEGTEAGSQSQGTDQGRELREIRKLTSESKAEVRAEVKSRRKDTQKQTGLERFCCSAKVNSYWKPFRYSGLSRKFTGQTGEELRAGWELRRFNSPLITLPLNS